MFEIRSSQVKYAYRDPLHGVNDKSDHSIKTSDGTQIVFDWTRRTDDLYGKRTLSGQTNKRKRLLNGFMPMESSRSCARFAKMADIDT